MSTEDQDGRISREEVNSLVDRVTESTRREFASAITTVQVQIGASEKILTGKIGSMKAWGIAALVGGQVLAGALGAVLAPGATSTALHAVTHLL